MDYKLLNHELGLLQVHGADSAKFLQGQLTNDIYQLDQQPYQLSAHLNNKGRILACFFITKVDTNTYHLITINEIINMIIPRLKMFILRSQVTIENIDAAICLSQYQPQYKHFKFLNNWYLYIDPMMHIPQNITPENINTILVTVAYLWKNILIDNALPLVYAVTQGIFIPQHISFDSVNVNGVSFKKGCYTGQEIVARTHYLGKVKRKLYKFVSQYTVAIGQKLLSPELDNQEVGTIVDWSTIPNNIGYHGLISLQQDSSCKSILRYCVENNPQNILIRKL